MTDTMQTKAFKAYGSKVLDESKGIVEAIVAVFNTVDHANERIKPGAFTKTLQELTPKGIYFHDWTRPIGKTLEAKELLPGDPLLPAELKDYGGLYIKGQLNLKIKDGFEAFSNIEMGVLDEYSFGYDVIAFSMARDGAKDLEELRMYEWSPVLFGCNSNTTTISAKDRQGSGVAASDNPSPASTTMEGMSNNDQGADTKPQNKDLAPGKTKALHLGKYLESNLVMSMLSELWWSAYWRIDTILWNWDGTLSRDEQKQQVADLFAEFGQYALKIVDILEILWQVGGEPETEGAKALMSEVKTKSIEGFYRKSIEAQFTAADDGSSLLAGIKSFTEMTASALKEGKPFSTSNETTITEACDGLEAISQKLRDMLESAKKNVPNEGGTPADPAPAEQKDHPATTGGQTSEKTTEETATANSEDGAGNVKERDAGNEAATMAEVEIARYFSITTING